MGFGSKRKSPWRYRFCHKLCIALAILPIAVVIAITVTVIARSFIMAPDTGTPIIQFTHTDDFVSEAKILERAERLAGALRIPTVSYEPDVQEKQAILKLHQYLEKSKSSLHKHSKRPFHFLSLMLFEISLGGFFSNWYICIFENKRLLPFVKKIFPFKRYVLTYRLNKKMFKCDMFVYSNYLTYF